LEIAHSLPSPRSPAEEPEDEKQSSSNQKSWEGVLEKKFVDAGVFREISQARAMDLPSEN